MWSLLEDEGWPMFLWCPLPKDREVPLWPSSFNLVGLCWFGQSSEFLPLSGLFCEHTRSCLPLSLKTLTLGTLIHCARSPATSVEGWEWRRAVPLSSGTCHFHQAPDMTEAILASTLHPPAVFHQCPMMALKNCSICPWPSSQPLYLSCICFPGGTSGKESTRYCKRHRGRRFDPWVKTIPWKRKWQPAPVFLPGESHGQRSLAGYSPWGCRELDTTEAT